MKYLVTGGLGFLGSTLTHRLVNEGHKVTIVDKALDEKNVADIKNQIKVIHGNIANRAVVSRAMTNQDGVFHFAAQVDHILSQHNPYLDLETNLIGVLNILESMRKQCPDAPLLYSCTRSVYGRQKILPIKEIAPTNPIDNYGITKLGAEKFILAYNHHYEIKTTSFRLSNLFGPRQILTPVYQYISYVFFCVATKRPFTFYGDGNQTRDFLYIDDAVNAFMMGMENIDKINGKIFNLGGKDYVTWNRMMEIAAKVTGGKINVSYIPHTPLRAKLENPHSILDYRKIFNALGWSPEVGLKEGFKNMLEFYSKNNRWDRYMDKEAIKRRESM